MDASILFWLAPVGAFVALIFAWVFYSGMMAADPGSERSQEIAGFVKEGAMSYLFAQYRIVSIFFLFAFAFFAFLAFVLGVQSPWTPFAFLTGGFFSGLAGYLGMMTATNASSRTAAAAAKSLDQGLQVAFRSGAVMGFVVVGLGLFDISIWWKILTWVMEKGEAFKDSAFAVHNYMDITTIMLTFGMGASTQALFARVGGGIFTKAADVGADLVGKTEAGIPEDDPRNPAVIADNVGDNVGDVAGMGADLYESYCGSILATTALGASAFAARGAEMQLAAITLPLAIAGIGILFSLLGVYFVKTGEDASQKELMAALSRGINVAAALTAVGSAILTYVLLPQNVSVAGSILAGLMAGIVIGWTTEYYTSSDYGPTKEVAEQSTTGPATVIIEGLATGMISTGIPVLTVCIGILFAFGFAGGFSDSAMGLYGIGIAAVGMLSTLGITLATDAYGPIADNAGGNAEMSGMGPEIRKRTDALDSLGNTTAATGKGFAIGSAALTAMALLGAYIEEIRVGLERVARSAGTSIVDQHIYVFDKSVKIMDATMSDFMVYYDVNLMNPQVLVGVFIGAMMVFVFCAMTMKAVGRAAHSMVEEVRRQFREIPGLLKGDPEAKPDYRACVAISTKGAQREMIVPSLLAIVTPIIVGLLLGVAGVLGMLVGGLSTGFVVAIMMSNAGGAWDNAKKYIESGQMGGKGSDNHKATVVGDTVGDPFKDTSGPSLNILIKLMSMVAVVVAGLTVSYSPQIQYALGFNPSEHRYKEDARRRYAEGSLTFQDSDGKAFSPLEEGILDEEEPLLGNDDTILPEDTEGLIIDDPDEITPNKESGSTGASVSGSASTGGGFGEGGFDEPAGAANSGAADSPFDGGGFGDEPADNEPATTDSGAFGGGFDEPSATDAAGDTAPDAADSAATGADQGSETPADGGGFGGGFDGL